MMTTFGDTTAAAIVQADKQANLRQDLQGVPTYDLWSMRFFIDMSAQMAEDFGDTDKVELSNRNLRAIDAELDSRETAQEQ